MNKLPTKYIPQGIKVSRGLRKGTHKVKTPRVLKIFLRSVVPSKKRYSKHVNKSDVFKLDSLTYRAVKRINGKKGRKGKQKDVITDEEKTVIEKSVEGYFYILRGYINIFGFDMLMFFIDEVNKQQKREIEITAYEVLKELKRAKGGKDYNDLFKQLENLAALGMIFSEIETTESRVRRTLSSKQRLIRLFDIETEETKGRKRGENRGKVIIKVRFSNILYESIREYYSLIDWKVLRSIKEPTIKLLYVYIRLMDFGHVDIFLKAEEVLEFLNIVVDKNKKEKIKKIIEGLRRYTLIRGVYLEKRDTIFLPYQESIAMRRSRGG